MLGLPFMGLVFIPVYGIGINNFGETLRFTTYPHSVSLVKNNLWSSRLGGFRSLGIAVPVPHCFWGTARVSVLGPGFRLYVMTLQHKN